MFQKNTNITFAVEIFFIAPPVSRNLRLSHNNNNNNNIKGTTRRRHKRQHAKIEQQQGFRTRPVSPLKNRLHFYKITISNRKVSFENLIHSIPFLPWLKVRTFSTCIVCVKRIFTMCVYEFKLQYLFCKMTTNVCWIKNISYYIWCNN